MPVVGVEISRSRCRYSVQTKSRSQGAYSRVLRVQHKSLGEMSKPTCEIRREIQTGGYYYILLTGRLLGLLRYSLSLKQLILPQAQPPSEVPLDTVDVPSNAL